ncbi:allene oxide synthase-lipoxygenase protein-like [Tubulanus polymorphus]|uniref:allene oxide synthase-lipoxygenase protein-like n=1 Tax=Tubulanus polymorphus TaxID=672921 RepID=UPI003DA22D26
MTESAQFDFRMTDGKIWMNKGYDIFKDVKGLKAFEDLQKIQFKKAGCGGGSVGLCLETFKFKTIFGVAAHKQGLRPSHPTGVGGLGFAEILENDQIPENDFFIPGRRFRVRIRHGNFNLDDDAGLDGRSASIKFIDAEDGGPLDLVMNTGHINFFHNLVSFGEFTESFILDNINGFRDWLFKYPINIYTVIELMRRAPDSYCNMTYYCHATEIFYAKDGKRRYARFRLVPRDGVADQDSGLPDEQDQRELWKRGRRENIDLPKNYLRQEFKTRLRSGQTANYVLQIQLHLVTDTDTHEIFNSSVAWNEKTHPWLSAVAVTITTAMADDAMERTKTNLRHHPKMLAFPEARNQYDYNSLAHARIKVYPVSQAVRLRRLAPTTEPQTEYVIVVKTSNKEKAGTDGSIYITLIGSLSSTQPILLDHELKDDFQRDSLLAYEVYSVDVGEILAIKMELKTGFKDYVCLDYVLVFHTEMKYHTEFPCYMWLKDVLYLPRGHASISEDENSFLRENRKIEIAERRSRFDWRERDGLPSGLSVIDQLPIETQHPHIDTSCNHVKPFSNDISIDTELRYQFCENLKNDVEFGRDFVNGGNMYNLKRCSSMPPCLSAVDISQTLDIQIQDEMKAGRIYLAQYPQLRALLEGTSTDKYVSSPVALFHVTSDKTVLPIAIRLYPENGEDNPIWLPTDDPVDWWNAKLWLKCADIQQQILDVHLFRSHFVVEPFLVACYRNLSSANPVYKLITSYTRGLLARNLIGWSQAERRHPGPVSYLSNLAFKFDANDLFLKKVLAKNGLADSDKLPDYRLREDGSRMWDTIEEFVQNIVNASYTDDQQLIDDRELENWINDVKLNGFPKGSISEVIPDKFTSLQLLVEWLTMIVFTATCVHCRSKITKQTDCAGAVLDWLPFMRQSPPTAKGTTTPEDIYNALPIATDSLVKRVTEPSSKHEKKVKLAQFLPCSFTDECYKKIIHKLRDNLTDLPDFKWSYCC